MNTRKIKPSAARLRPRDSFRDICQVFGSYYWGEALGNDWYDYTDTKETEFGFPVLRPVDALPTDLWSFRDGPAKKHPEGCFLHFCADDFCFEIVWKEGKKYSDMIKQNFSGTLGPDFSLLAGMPAPQIIYQIFRSRACVWRWQHDGINAIPFVRWFRKGSSYWPLVLSGLPVGSTLACGAHGSQWSEIAQERFNYGIERITYELQPKRWIVVGNLVSKGFVAKMRKKCEVIIYRECDLRKTRDAFRRTLKGGE